MTHRTIDASHDPVIDEMYEGLRVKLRTIRQNAGISQRKIALEIGMNLEIFNRVDNGKWPAEGPHFAVWARSLGRRLAIADGTGCEPIPPITLDPGMSFLRHEYLRISCDLRGRRLASEKSIKETAEELGCTTKHVGNLEKARVGRFVAIRTLLAWCHSLGCHVELVADKELHALVLKERQEIERVVNRGIQWGKDIYGKPAT